MEGIEMVARDSFSRFRESTDRSSSQFQQSGRMSMSEEAALSYFSEVVNTDDDERNWSFPHLRRQLEVTSSRDLFRRYQKRVQHALFVEMLLMNLLVNAVAIAAMAPPPVKDDTPSEEIQHEEFLIFTFRFSRGLNLAVQAILFAAAFARERWFNGCLAASITLIFVVIGEMSTDLALAIQTMERDGPGTYTRAFTYYIVLSSTVLLSSPRKRTSAIAASIIVVVDRCLTILSYLLATKTSFRSATILAIAEAVFLVVTLLVGVAIRYLMEVMGRRAFLDRRECLDSKINIENEKDREEKLLESVLPKHIAREVREDIGKVVYTMLEVPRKPFKKLYVARYEDVSILYADIVNSMLLGASLCVADLVDTLNDLFGSFDAAAQENNCMRIKLLGDCYYCISGFPEDAKSEKSRKKPIGHHSDNCVLTGLKMIRIIRKIRESRDINVDMRIGVHSGNVLGGLLGLSKWQFDIWSKDVTIASHMEQSGVPGHVHITKVTKDFLKEEYKIKPGDGHLRDPYLDSEGIRTFLVIPTISARPHKVMMQISTEEIPKSSGSTSRFTRQTSSIVIENQNRSRYSSDTYYERQSSNFGLIPKRQRHVLDYSLQDYRKQVNHVNRMMEKAIDKMSLSKRDQWCSSEGIQPLFLTFREGMKLEKPYHNQPDPLFKYYMLCALLILSGITIIHLLLLPPTWGFWILFSITLVFVLVSSFASWAGYLELKICKKDDSDLLVQKKDSVLLKISRGLWKKTTTRVSLMVMVCFLMLGCSLIGIEELLYMKSNANNATISKPNNSNFTHSSELFLLEERKEYYTFCVALALTATSVFLRIHYLVKLVLKVAAIITFCRLYLVDMPPESNTKYPNREAFGGTPEQSLCFYLIFVGLILHLLDRQVEYICRLDFVWRSKLQDEREEATRVETANRMLLQNILPLHVTKFYLNVQNQKMPESPYHEECSSVAILFASIPSFANFYIETELNEAGLKCIQLLNEIVCDFDELLLKKFREVEKIKTIGSTYMAACGLSTCNNARNSGSFGMQDEGTEQDRKRKNVVTLAVFASHMMAILNDINKDAMQEFRIRAGIAVGRVMAGVVGTVKPQYDIWGDAVNVASRMDSTGVPGRIQVTEEVADIIKSSNAFECECRGEIFVKGKGNLTTYFLITSHDQPDNDNTQL